MSKVFYVEFLNFKPVEVERICLENEILCDREIKDYSLFLSTVNSKSHKLQLLSKIPNMNQHVLSPTRTKQSVSASCPLADYANVQKYPGSNPH